MFESKTASNINNHDELKYKLFKLNTSVLNRSYSKQSRKKLNVRLNFNRHNV